MARFAVTSRLSPTVLFSLAFVAIGSACSPSSAPDGGPSTAGKAIGAACIANTDCQSNQCDTALGSYCVASCSSDGACPSGASCAEPDSTGTKLCLPSCTESSDCRLGYVCDTTQKVCLPHSSMSTGCQTAGCASGKTCDTTTGQCVTTVTTCSATSCAAGETCDATTGRCVTASSGGCTSTGCPSGETCDTTSGQCMSSSSGGCTSTGCPSGETCDTTSGQCVSSSTGGPLTNTGAACTADSDCMGGNGAGCLPAASPSYFTGGYCTANCMTDTDCGSGGICVSDFFVGNDGGPVAACMRGCTTASDCRSDYVCVPDGSQSFCLPDDCRVVSNLCSGTQTCNQSTGACTTPTMVAGYPATFPSPPQVTNYGGAVLATPKIVAIFFANDTEASTLAPFFTGFPKTALWSALSEYGIGAGTAQIVNLTETAPTTIDDTATSSGGNTALETWLLAEISSGAIPMPDANTEYMINYPAGTTVTSDGASGGSAGCNSFGGYHIDMQNGTQDIAYGVIPRCPASNGFTLVQTFTASASHEIIEAATDPYPNYNPAWAYADSPHIFWDEGNDGSEIGDMCENDPEAYYQFPDLPFVVQRFWSNTSAAAGDDPCVPYYSSEIYFNAIPEAPDMISFDYYGQTAPVVGNKIALGASGTVTVDLYSDQPTSAWTVAIEDGSSFFFGGTKLLTITNPSVTTGSNGTKLNFTVKVAAKGSSANNMAPGTELFVVTSTQGTGNNATEHFWYGVVGQQ